MAAKRFRILLDQNFPKPPGFDISEIDDTVEVVHVADHDADLTERHTPDWYIYLRAARDGFNALVTRDASQLGLPEEMFVLTRIRLTIVSFRQAVEDPIVEWGQLLAYLPAIRHRDESRHSQIILLPRPELTQKNERAPKEALATIARDLGCSVAETRRNAESAVTQHLGLRGEVEEYHRLMKLKNQGSTGGKG